MRTCTRGSECEGNKSLYRSYHHSLYRWPTPGHERGQKYFNQKIIIYQTDFFFRVGLFSNFTNLFNFCNLKLFFFDVFIYFNTLILKINFKK
jgi:hypothetical protein